MKPHRRIRKTIKWGGLVLTVLLVVVWIGSTWWFVGWMNGNTFWMRINPGWVELGQARPPNPAWNTPGWTMARVGRAEYRWTIDLGSSRFLAWFVAIPLWIPLMATMGMSALAWRLDYLASRRHVRLNLCPKCNYDRMGLAAGAACPECGTAPVSE